MEVYFERISRSITEKDLSPLDSRREWLHQRVCSYYKNGAKCRVLAETKRDSQGRWTDFCTAMIDVTIPDANLII
jgi:hypothetical protein